MSREKERGYGIEIAPNENEISREWSHGCFLRLDFDAAVHSVDSVPILTGSGPPDCQPAIVDASCKLVASSTT